MRYVLVGLAGAAGFLQNQLPRTCDATKILHLARLQLLCLSCPSMLKSPLHEPESLADFLQIRFLATKSASASGSIDFTSTGRSQCVFRLGVAL